MSVHRGQLVLLELETSPETRGPWAHRLPHHLAAIKVLEVGVLGGLWPCRVRHGKTLWMLPSSSASFTALYSGQKFIAFLPFKIPWSFRRW